MGTSWRSAPGIWSCIAARTLQASEPAKAYGQLVCPVTETGPPPDHTMHFAGEYPCEDGGARDRGLATTAATARNSPKVCGSTTTSRRRPVAGTYEDYHHKMTHYAQVIGRCARRIDPGAVSRAGQLVLSADRARTVRVHGDCVEPRRDNTTERETVRGQDRHSRAWRHGVVPHSGLRSRKCSRVERSICSTATGSSSTTQFRAPGPTTTEELERKPTKARLYSERYSKMRSGVVGHEPGRCRPTTSTCLATSISCSSPSTTTKPGDGYCRH